MKKIFLFILALQLTSICIFAQKKLDANKVETLNGKNQEIVSYFNKGEFVQAQQIALEAIDLSVEIYGKDSIRTASAYTNLAEIYRMSREFDKAVVNFSNAIEILNKDVKRNAIRLINLLGSKGTALAISKKKSDAEKDFTRMVSLAEQVYGKESAKLLPILKKQSDFYIYVADFDSADEVFIRSKIIAYRSKESVSIDYTSDQEDGVTCYLHTYLGSEEIKRRERKISDAVAFALKDELKLENKDIKRIDGGVVNGKALKLAVPTRSGIARQNNLSGKVLVRIIIDTKGKVINAKAFCGNKYLRQGSERAALRSKFTPTLLDGEPVEVSGLIVYNY